MFRFWEKKQAARRVEAGGENIGGRLLYILSTLDKVEQVFLLAAATLIITIGHLAFAIFAWLWG